MDRGRPSQTSQVGLLSGSLLNNYPWSMFWWNTQDECCSFILLKETESKNRFFCILSLCTWVRLSSSTVVVRGGRGGGVLFHSSQVSIGIYRDVSPSACGLKICRDALAQKRSGKSKWKPGSNVAVSHVFKYSDGGQRCEAIHFHFRVLITIPLPLLLLRRQA